jgi:hypothetical protein
MTSQRRGLSRAIRQWWPVPAVLVGSLTIQKVFFESRFDVSGHAAEHLSSATAPFFAAALIIILLWATPSARRQPDILLACAAWLIATVLVLVGNVRVVDALIDAGLGDTATDQTDFPAAVVSAHGLANTAPWFADIAALILVAAFWRRHHITTAVAIGAGVLTVLFPPWIFPGAGVIVVVIARCVALGRSARPLAAHSR